MSSSFGILVLWLTFKFADHRFAPLVWAVPVVPAMQCFHRIDAPDLGERYCTGECVWSDFEGDYYSEPPRSSTPPESVVAVNGGSEGVSSPIYHLTSLMFIIRRSQRLPSAPPPAPEGPPMLPIPPRQHQRITPQMTQLWDLPFAEASSSLPTISTVASLVAAIGSYAVNPSFPSPNPLQFVPPHLEISASTKREAALELEYIMGRCWGDENAAMLLTPHRDFRL